MSKIKLLVIEDDSFVFDFVSYALPEGKFDVISAEDGIQALELLSKGRPDVILLDVMMPRMSGLQFCQEIMKDPAGKSIPKILMTASVKVEWDPVFDDYGIKAMIRKPFTADELLEKIKDMVGWRAE